MLRLYDTYRGRIVRFKPLRKKEVRMYACGPTVYDYAHIGNFRSFITADILRRYLIYSGYKVAFVRNITDVGHLTEEDLRNREDRIILAAKREQRTPEEIIRFYTDAFLRDAEKLHLLTPTHQPRASAFINEIIGFIQSLIKKKHAYVANGNVFFSVESFPKYGSLSKNTIANLRTGGRLDAHPDKRDPLDFALWLRAPKNHLMQWPSPWGKGYPGWHIECSAMSTKLLGPTIDIHMGGEDAVFPHHENEIAQSESKTGKPFAQYWVHTRFMLIKGEKISKSLNNYITVADLEKKGFSPMSLRALMLLTHYRKKLNFTFEALRGAQEIQYRIQSTYEALSLCKGEVRDNKRIAEIIKKTKRDVGKALDMDINTPRAFASFIRLIKRINPLIIRGLISKRDSASLRKHISELDKIFGILEERKICVPPEIRRLVAQREQHRKRKEWELADKIRDIVLKKGYAIEDRVTGPHIEKSR